MNHQSIILKKRIREAQEQQKEAVTRHLQHGDVTEAMKVARGYKNLVIHLYLKYLENKP